MTRQDGPRIVALRAQKEIMTRQRLPYFVGVSADTTGATRLSMHMVVIPPGARDTPHLHYIYGADSISKALNRF